MIESVFAITKAPTKSAIPPKASRKYWRNLSAELVSLEAEVNPLARIYLNRLSDLLFIAARAANAAASVSEPLWKPGG